VTALAGGKLFEITALRRDVETDGRHAVIAFTEDWAEDAARRDFTINALYARLDGEIFDYATGVEDLIAGRVRFMGDPKTRIAEDYLRILRLFRFHAWYGKGEIDADALRAAAEARDRLNSLSGERVAKELLKLLEAANPAPALRMMAATGILPELLPGALQLPRLERLAQIDVQDRLAPDAILRLAALLPDDGRIITRVADRLRLSNAQRARLLAMPGGDQAIGERLSAAQARRILYRIGPQAFRDRVLLQWAGAPRGVSAMPWRLLLTMADNWQAPRFPLTGRDVMAAGVPEGPEVGKVLAALEQWWVDGDFAADEGALRDRLAVMVGR
jgi:poly(A) polymerase